MKHIVIIGAGIGGLYTAIRLVKLGLSPDNITIIDTRVGQYTRPGHLSEDAFHLVEKLTDISTKNFSSAQHIKELERMMYQVLSKKPIRFITAEFIGIKKSSGNDFPQVQVRYHSGEEAWYNAELIFDCSGRQAHVAKAINRQFPNPFFTALNPLNTSDLPTHHIVAQVILPHNDHLKDCFYQETNNILKFPLFFHQKSAEEKSALIKRLQGFGWRYTAFPTFYSFAQQDSDKTCPYMEAPGGLCENQIHEWIQLLIHSNSDGKLLTFKELPTSRKYAKKPRISYFENIPHVVEQTACQLPELPIVILGFDALKSSDHRLANGVISGIELCERTLSRISIEYGKITACDIKAINTDTKSYIWNTHLPALKSFLQTRRESIAEQSLEFKVKRENSPPDSLLTLLALVDRRRKNSPLNRDTYLREESNPDTTPAM